METDPNLLLTVGIVILVLSVPSLLSSWAESRAPRMGAIMFVAAVGLIVAALMTNPGGYNFKDVPGIMVKVLAGFFQ